MSDSTEIILVDKESISSSLSFISLSIDLDSKFVICSAVLTKGLVAIDRSSSNPFSNPYTASLL